MSQLERDNARPCGHGKRGPRRQRQKDAAETAAAGRGEHRGDTYRNSARRRSLSGSSAATSVTSSSAASMPACGTDSGGVSKARRRRRRERGEGPRCTVPFRQPGSRASRPKAPWRNERQQVWNARRGRGGGKGEAVRESVCTERRAERRSGRYAARLGRRGEGERRRAKDGGGREQCEGEMGPTFDLAAGGPRHPGFCAVQTNLPKSTSRFPMGKSWSTFSAHITVCCAKFLTGTCRTLLINSLTMAAANSFVIPKAENEKWQKLLMTGVQVRYRAANLAGEQGPQRLTRRVGNRPAATVRRNSKTKSLPRRSSSSPWPSTRPRRGAESLANSVCGPGGFLATVCRRRIRDRARASASVPVPADRRGRH